MSLLRDSNKTQSNMWHDHQKQSSGLLFTSKPGCTVTHHMAKAFNSLKPGVPFMGHRQTE